MRPKPSYVTRILLVLAVGLVGLLAREARADVLLVDASSTARVPDGSPSAPFPDVGSAVDAAAVDDELLVLPGDYPDPVTVDKRVSIVASSHLDAVVQDSTWTLAGSGAVVEGMRFVGTGGVAVYGTAPFTLANCQIEGYTFGLQVSGVAGETTVSRNRFLTEGGGALLFDSGWSNYVMFENNIFSSTAGWYGIYARDSRFRAYHNLVSGFIHGIYSTLVDKPSLIISYAVNNLIIADNTGIQGVGLGPAALRAYANAIDAPTPTVGLSAGDVLWTIEDGCGAPAGGFGLYDHGFTPDGACADAGVFTVDADGSPADIGPYGGSYGLWWRTFECREPKVFCPTTLLTDWLAARPEVRDATVFWEYGDGWESYDDWSSVLRNEMFRAFEDRWYGVHTALDPEPVNFADLAFDAPIWRTALSLGEGKDYYLAALARSFIVELWGLVPWSVDDYDASLLPMLFDGRSVFDEDLYCAVNGGSSSIAPDQPFPPWCSAVGLNLASHNNNVPTDPDVLADFMHDTGLIADDHFTTMANVIEWERHHLRHRAGSSSAEVGEYYWGHPGRPHIPDLLHGSEVIGAHPEGASPPTSHERFTNGCGSAASLFADLGRAFNIPAEVVYASFHGAVRLPTLDLYTDHGDSAYSALARGDHPAHELFIDGATFEAWFGPTVQPSVALANVGRRPAELAIESLPPAIMKHRCQDLNDGGTRVLDALAAAASAFELDAMGFWADLDTAIANAGGCTAVYAMSYNAYTYPL